MQQRGAGRVTVQLADCTVPPLMKDTIYNAAATTLLLLDACSAGAHETTVSPLVRLSATTKAGAAG